MYIGIKVNKTQLQKFIFLSATIRDVTQQKPVKQKRMQWTGDRI